MNRSKLSPEEKFDIIMQCRSSGLSDHQWCHENNLAPSTLYKWIAAFRKNGYPNIPEPTRRNAVTVKQSQEVVKLNIACDNDLSRPEVTNGTITSNISCALHATAEICTKDRVIRISNDINPQMLELILQSRGGFI